MFGRDERETVIALDAATGKARWEYEYEAPTKGLDLEEGKGPHASPLVTRDLVFTVGTTGKLHAIDRRSGKVAWAADLWNGLGGTKRDRGYSCSQIAYNDTVRVRRQDGLG
jgi:outer membrane protein assembly factor BamB